MDLNSGRFSEGIDAAYLFLYPGWETEMRGNRWHWAKRWARRVPTALVLPDRHGRAAWAKTANEPRIPNCRLLKVQHYDPAVDSLEVGLAQAAQIAQDIAEHGFRRPLLWLYYPIMCLAFGAVPAAGRVLHATENYFAYDDLGPDFLRHLQASVAQADLVIAVSEGVAAGFATHTDCSASVVVTNGVDIADYAGAVPDPELLKLGGGRRIAIYGGNINGRFDFDLLHSCTHRFEDTLFAFFGRIWLPRSEWARAWETIVARDNVVFGGEVAPERLPGLYAAADVGLIPYTHDPLLVENGFPLKVLEMAATGLPVVSTWMKPISALANAIVVTQTSAAFVEALSTLSRGTLTVAERDELEALCSRNDYDVKFAEALAAIDSQIPENRALSTRVDAAVSLAFDDWVLALLKRSRRAPTPRKPSTTRLPRSVRSLARRLRRALGPA